MVRINNLKDPSGRTIVSIHHDALLVAKVKAIEGPRWHPAEEHWEDKKSVGQFKSESRR